MYTIRGDNNTSKDKASIPGDRMNQSQQCSMAVQQSTEVVACKGRRSEEMQVTYQIDPRYGLNSLKDKF